MIVYHLTPRRNVQAIVRCGLIVPLKKKGRIWFATSKLRLASMMDHIAKHQNCKIRDMSCLILEVPPRELVKFGGKRIGIAVSYNDIDPSKIVAILY